MLTRRYRIPIYHGLLHIVFSDDFIESGKQLRMNFKPTANDCLGLSVRKSSEGPGEYAIFIKTHKRDSYDVIAHEALHIVNYLFEDRGVVLSTSNDEPQAYMLGWVVKKICEAKEALPQC